MMENTPIDSVTKFRKWTLAIAETIDAWRIIPRLLVAAYGYLTWEVVTWYMAIKPTELIKYTLENGEKVCSVTGLSGPTTQQAALVTTVVGAAAIVFGFYTKTGRDWSKPIIPWLKKKSETTNEKE